MILSERVYDKVEETGDILICGFIVLIIITFCFVFDKCQKKLKMKKIDFETKVAAQFKWDFFYALFVEGIVDIVGSVAEAILFLVGK